MKRLLTFAVLSVVILCGVSSCGDSTMGNIATYNGKVLNEYTDEPFADVDVKVTPYANGSKSVMVAVCMMDFLLREISGIRRSYVLHTR